jgi:hypothetical protein
MRLSLRVLQYVECRYCQVSIKHVGKELKLILKKVIWISRIDKIKCIWKENNGCKEKTDSKQL